MILTDREKQIIRVLLKSDDYVTSFDIAKETGISRRVIREEMKNVKSTFNSLGFDLESKTGQGYLVPIATKEDYNYLVAQLFETPTDSLLPSGAQERVSFIIKRLLFSNDFIKIDDLVEELHISRASISNDLKSIRGLIEPYNLSLSQKPYSGLIVEGNEFNRRRFLADFLAQDLQDSDAMNPDFFLNKYDTRKIYELIYKYVDDYKLELTDMVIDNLVLHICIAFSRIENDSFVPLADDEFKTLKSDESYPIAIKLAIDLEKNFDVSIPESEIAYLAMHLFSKRILSESLFDQVVDPECREILDEGLDKIHELYDYDFRRDEVLYLAVGIHLVQTIKRIRYNMTLRNPLLNEIRQKHSLAYDLATVFCSVIDQKINKKVSSNEISYFALHFLNALERYRKDDKIKVLIVCASGRGTAAVVSYQLKKSLSDLVEIVGETQSHRLRHMNFNNIDYVISTVPIKFKIPVPFVMISPFLEDKDIALLRDQLVAKEKLPLEKFFNPRLFKAHIKAADHEEVLYKMVELLKAEYDFIPDNFYDQLIEREHTSTTEFGNKVAIPHPIQPITDRVISCVFILENPILWYKKKVQIVFLTSIDSTKDYSVNIYHALARFVFDKDKVNELLNKPSFEKMIDILNKIEAAHQEVK